MTVKRLSCLASSRASSCADGADLTSASRTRASLQDTELAYADVRGAILDDADLSAADLAGAYFSYEPISPGQPRGGYTRLRATFLASNLKGADFTSSDSEEVRFDDGFANTVIRLEDLFAPTSSGS